jgi:hypothetical protein
VEIADAVQPHEGVVFRLRLNLAPLAGTLAGGAFPKEYVQPPMVAVRGVDGFVGD